VSRIYCLLAFEISMGELWRRLGNNGTLVSKRPSLSYSGFRHENAPHSLLIRRSRFGEVPGDPGEVPSAVRLSPSGRSRWAANGSSTMAVSLRVPAMSTGSEVTGLCMEIVSVFFKLIPHGGWGD
jgi:hypothetical protein